MIQEMPTLSFVCLEMTSAPAYVKIVILHLVLHDIKYQVFIYLLSILRN